MALKKLVRDHIPAIIEKETGDIVHTRVLDTDEYRHELKWKLLEEVREACAAQEPGEFLRELADLQEVIDANLKEYGLTRVDLLHAQKRKYEERGGFDKRLFIVKTKARR
jgi:predicted house-cleaning noncanonical NTP pyrophosphatase (MazG superfamily)